MKKNVPSDVEIQRAATQIRAGDLVAFPTETVYGLGANALDEVAVSKIFKAKGRPSDNPLIVHVPNLDAARPFLASPIDPLSEQLAALFWPGPLTIVLPKRRPLIVTGFDSCSEICLAVSGGLGTVGVRVPSHPVAQRLLSATGVPVAAPSANKSGSPSPTTAEHVLRDHINCPMTILDGGPCEVGLESTVVQVVEGRVVILRPGGISAEELRAHGFVIAKHVDCNSSPIAPGMKYRHYAPMARVVPIMTVTQWSTIEHSPRDLLVVFDTNVVHANGGALVSFGTNERDLQTASAKLFDVLRHADDLKASTVYIDCTFDRESGLGVALWNRISKAAEHVIH